MSDVEFKQNRSGLFGGTPNNILKGDGFYISYNADTRNSIMGGFFAGERDGQETALVRKEDGDRIFRILNGDWREQYANVFAGGFDACLKLFEENKKVDGSIWSTRECDRATSD